MTGDPYEVLGVRPEAPAAEVRRAYLALARRHHPDAHASGGPADRAAAERRMQEVTAAWAVLGDPARRAAFDRERAGPAPGAGADPGTGFRPFDPGPDPDPADAPDVPYRPAPPPSGRTRAARLAPGILFGASVGVFALAAVVGSGGLVALAVVLFLASCAGFVVLPLLALTEARRDEG
ncbi:MAG TPA: J domain-containing protein [Acidimicrobiales bacterium]|nr:J domain-containing protein [Acidimicrobiales bacterium]